MVQRQQRPQPPSILCSPQPDLRGEPDKGEQQSAPEQPAGECRGREKFSTSGLGTGSLGHPEDLFQPVPQAVRRGKALGSTLCPALCLQHPLAGRWVTPCALPAHVPTQDDTCLAELALALSLSLEISKQQLVGIRLRVRTLQAELHEGLFCSPLLHHVTAGAQRSTAGEQPSAGQGQGWGQALGRAGAGSPHACTAAGGIWLCYHCCPLQGAGVWARAFL